MLKCKCDELNFIRFSVGSKTNMWVRCWPICKDGKNLTGIFYVVKILLPAIECNHVWPDKCSRITAISITSYCSPLSVKETLKGKLLKSKYCFIYISIVTLANLHPTAGLAYSLKDHTCQMPNALWSRILCAQWTDLHCSSLLSAFSLPVSST